MKKLVLILLCAGIFSCPLFADGKGYRIWNNKDGSTTVVKYDGNSTSTRRFEAPEKTGDKDQDLYKAAASAAAIGMYIAPCTTLAVCATVFAGVVVISAAKSIYDSCQSKNVD